MATTTQPASGSSLPSSSLASGLVFARNESDATASRVLAGSCSIEISSGVSWGTDADGRYKIGSGGAIYETWTGVTLGAERTLFAIYKRVDNGSWQVIIDSDAAPPRNFIWDIESDGTVKCTIFDSSGNIIGAPVGSVAMSTSVAQPVICRVRNDAGTYKARVDVGTAAGTETALSAAPGWSGVKFNLLQRMGGGGIQSAAKIYFSAIWNRALTDSEMAGLGANGWSLFDVPAAATAVTLSGPTSGAAGAASGNFTVSVNGSLSSPVTVTFSDGGAGGTFTPSSVTLDSSTPSATATYTAASGGAKTISVTNSGGLTNPSSITYTATAPDTTVPTLTGSITIGTVTTASIQASWPAGSDNTAVTSYETSLDGTTWTDRGNVLTYTFTGLTAGTSYTIRVRAKDAAGNVSTPPLSVTQSTAAAAVGTIAGEPIKTPQGQLVTSTIPRVAYLKLSDLSKALELTNQTPNSSGMLSVSNASLVTGTAYVRLLLNADGSQIGAATYTAT